MFQSSKLVDGVSEGEAVTKALNVADYLKLPALDVRDAVGLGVALLESIPSGAPPQVRDHAKEMRGAILGLQCGWAEQHEAIEESICSAGVRLEGAWEALHDALVAVTRLPRSRERSWLGRLVLNALFPAGKRFGSIPAAQQWRTSEHLLGTIQAEKLERKISLATGHPEFLEEISEAHHAYLMIRSPATNTSHDQSDQRLRNRLTQFRAATDGYVLQLAAWCFRSGFPEGIDALEAGLRPIALLMTASRAGDGGGVLGGEVVEAALSSSSREQHSPYSWNASPQTPVPEIA